MALELATGTFLTPGTTGNHPVVTGLSFQPKLVLMFGNGRTNASGNSNNSRAYIGASTGNGSNFCASYRDEDDVSTTNAERVISNTQFSQVYQISGTTKIFKNTMQSLDSGGFTLNYSSTSGNATINNWMCLGGSDVEQVEVGTFQVNSGVTGTQDIILSGAFKPDGLIFVTAHASVLDSDFDDVHLSTGFSDFTSQYCMSATSEDGKTSTSNCNRVLSNTSVIIRQAKDSQTIEGEANVDSALSNGFRINITNSFTSSDQVIYIAIKGPKIKVSDFPMSTVVGAFSETGVGFQPTGLFSMTSEQVSFGGRSDFIQTMGFCTSSSARSCSANTSQNNQTTSDASSRARTDRYIIGVDFNNNVRSVLDFTSFDADGFTLQQESNTAATAEIIMYMAFGPKGIVVDQQQTDLKGGLTGGLNGGFQ